MRWRLRALGAPRALSTEVATCPSKREVLRPFSFPMVSLQMRRLILPPLAAALAFAALPVLLSGQTRLDRGTWADRIASLESDLPDWMEEAGIPGVAIAVVTSGDVWQGDFGVRDVAQSAPVEATTVFEAASLSKPIFARLVEDLVREGSLDLDRSLSEYWEYPDLAEAEWADEITARTVLTHRTGLPNWRRDRPLEIQFRPGERFQYSGEGYVYLQRVVAEVTGKALSEWAAESLFEPMDLTRSSFVFETDDPNFASPHHSEGHTLAKRPSASPGNAAASLHTTAADYGRFIQATLRGMQTDPERHSSMARDATPVAPGLAWGLGWGLELSGEGEPALWHWGDNGPFKAFVFVDPRSDVGFVFFANSTNGLAITKRVLLRLFPGEHAVLDWLRYDQLN